MRYWAYLNGEVPGSFSPEQLAAVPGFTGGTLVCPSEGEIDEKSWRRAGEFEEIARALAVRPGTAPLSAPASPPRPSPPRPPPRPPRRPRTWTRCSTTPVPSSSTTWPT
jgi:hypothetical protein